MRTAEIKRKTKETDIEVFVKLDGEGKVSVNTGIGFFDHMLTALGVHSGIDMDVECTGDLYVDGHHTVEDVGICLGKAFAEALGDKAGIARYGSAFVPMDEALAFCSLDISGRPFLVFDAEFPQEMCGQYNCAMTVEFMRALAYNAGITLHIKSLYGDNSHHITEAIYKAVAHALRLAVKENTSNKPLSTKGVL